MDKAWSFLKGPYGSWLRVVLAFALFAFLELLQNGGSLSDLNLPWWQHVVAVVVAATLPVIIAALNPLDPRFGKK